MIRLLALLLLLPSLAAAQQRRDETHYYPGAFNWQFLKHHNAAGRLFNAFDFGHAILYERLVTLPLAEAKVALDRDYDFLVNDLLVKPPSAFLEVMTRLRPEDDDQNGDEPPTDDGDLPSR